MSNDFDPEFATLRDYAREYHRLGLTPVPCKFPKNSLDEKSWKHPPVPWKKEQYAQISEDKLEEWFSNPSYKNIGLLTGAASNGIFVVDLDLYKDEKGEASGWWQESLDMQEIAGEIEDTWTATSASGGKHYYYKMPNGWKAPQDSTEQNVDFRGQGGFIICPPSVNHLRQAYEWVDGYAPWDIEIATAPMWFCNRIDEYMAKCVKTKGKQTYDRSNSSDSGYEQDPFTGAFKDGREKHCYQWAWRGAMELRSQFLNGGYPTDDQVKEAFLKSYDIYLKKNLPKDDERKAYPNLTDEEILETVGRGLSAYSIRFNSAMSKWDDELLQAVNNPRNKTENNNSGFEETNKTEEQPNQSRFKILDYDDIMSIPDPVYMVDGLIIENSLVFFAGDPGVGKSFAAMSLAMAVANKKPTWMNRNVKKHGAVIYISTEGNNDMKFRLKAWESEYGRLEKKPPIHLIGDQMNLMVEQDVNDLIAAIEAKMAQIGEEVALIVFDTVSKNMPGADENLQKDMTLFIKACDRIRLRFKTTVVGVHHLSRNGSGQMRGSTVLDGAADTIAIFEKVKGDKTKVKVTAKKIKSAEDGWEEFWGIKKVIIGFHTSLVLTPPTGEAPKPSEEEEFGGDQETGFTYIGKKFPDVVVKAIFDLAQADWDAKRPWSEHKQAASRYGATRIYGVVKDHMPHSVFSESDARFVFEYLTRKDFLVPENYTSNKMSKEGLKVNKRPNANV